MEPETDISALLRILLACVKAGTVGFLVTVLLYYKGTIYIYNCFIYLSLISFPATNTRIACICMVSRSVTLAVQ